MDRHSILSLHASKENLYGSSADSRYRLRHAFIIERRYDQCELSHDHFRLALQARRLAGRPNRNRTTYG